jgi:hypothetical protein
MLLHASAIAIHTTLSVPRDPAPWMEVKRPMRFGGERRTRVWFQFAGMV